MKSSMRMFLFTGIFLIVSFSINLYVFLQTEEFVWEFPGDWDKVIGICVGVFLLIRSRRFYKQTLGCFIQVDDKKIQFRIRERDEVQRIFLTDISDVSASGNTIKITKVDGDKIKFDLDVIDDKKDRKSVIEALLECNHSTLN